MKQFTTKFLSFVLALIMALGVFSFGVFADGEDDAAAATDTAATDTAAAGDENTDAAAADEEEKEEDIATKETNRLLTTKYQTQEEKLYTMTLMQSVYGYELYADQFSGEVALKNVKTGEVLFSNPFDVATSPSSNDIKCDLLSQIIMSYTDNTGASFTLRSFDDAAKKEQIKVKTISNGIRVEYSLGDEETRYCLPMQIEAGDYMDLIYGNLPDRATAKFDAYYVLQDPNDDKLSDRVKADMKSKYPATAEGMAIYVFDTEASAREKILMESFVNTYCKDFTYATLEEVHQKVGYSVVEQAPPLFKMALEYTLDENGLQVRLPANGIRFDEDAYTISTIKVLPYFGAGANPNTGYTFVPDGSGALFAFEDLVGSAVSVTGKVYGVDYAYHEIGTVKSETMRLPVYGVVENYVGNTAELYKHWVPDVVDEETGEVLTEAHWEVGSDYTPVTENRGFFAIIQDGDALASITTNHGGSQHKYNSVYTSFSPRPSDSFNLQEAMTVADDTVWTITSNRKYTGSYSVRIVMLTDEAKAEAAGLSEDEYYECSYVGMAKAYRDYLERTGEITPMTKDDVDKDIPLYIESFGAVDTDGTFLSIPVKVKEALTTFEDVENMYAEISEKGITNVNFRLTGFTNGGMISTVPNGVDFEKVVGNEKGFEALVADAKANGYGVFPEFDLAYAQQDKNFDGLNLKRDGTKTIDNRYTTKRVYYSSYQDTLTTNALCISPSVFSDYYKNLSDDIQGLGATNISLSTIGSDLNSDFNKSDSYNREDAKELVQGLLATANEDYDEVMVDAGNAYTFKYADHILNVVLDSSHYNYASRTVPFIGMVLHGYVNFAGEPTNMSSDIDYETLRMLENGALPYFTLSCQNTALLKEDETLSKYYSVAYDIWVDDLVEVYNTLNSLLAEVQTSTIENHEFLEGRRVATEEELAIDQENEELAQAQATSDALAAKLEDAQALAGRDGEDVVDEDVVDATADEPATDDADAEPVEDDTVVEEPEVVAPQDKYLVNDGTIVRVTYSNGVSYLLNYNRFEISVEIDGTTYTVSPLGYLKLEA